MTSKISKNHLKLSSAACLAFFLAGVAPRPANAAPFCTQVTGITPECMYVDATECRARAAQLKGRCVVNPADYHIVTGNARYCLVTSDRVSLCTYEDYQSCDHDAGQTGQAACLDNVPHGEPADVFRTEPKRRY
jgi:hypothetical protein